MRAVICFRCEPSPPQALPHHLGNCEGDIWGERGLCLDRSPSTEKPWGYWSGVVAAGLGVRTGS